MVKSLRLPLAKSLSSPSAKEAKRTAIWRRSAPRPHQPLTNALFLRGWHPFIRICGISTVSLVAAGGTAALAFLAWDATTYRTRKVGEVPVNPLAVKLERGGKKNLQIAQVLLDDEESLESKPKLVVIGGGWGAVATLKNLNPGDYHVVVVSPSNYTLFTPLLPSATVGTVEVRSLVEPLRKIISRVHGHYIQAECVDIDLENRLIEIAQPNGQPHVYLPYDKTIIACGSTSNTHGVPGLENSFQLKTIPDAQGIRRAVMENLERAAMPGIEEKERNELLSFVICGGGPTGVEFASELYDMINEDVLDYFPKVLRKSAKVHIIQSRDHILNTYSEKISQYAEQKFERDEIDTVLNARVKEIKPEGVVYMLKGEKDHEGKPVEHFIPAKFVLWSTGIAMNPFTATVAARLPDQYHRHALEVDSHLRVVGAPLGTIYAIGDAATIETNLLNHLLEMVKRFDKDEDGRFSYDEFEGMMGSIRRKFPTSQVHVEKIRHVFEKYDKDKDGTISLNELTDMFAEISNKMTALPATAQVANQQGAYLGRKLNKIAKSKDTLERLDQLDDPDEAIFEPFNYRHLGNLAYIGNAAVFDFPVIGSWAGGLIAAYLWRGVYWSEQVSSRTRLLLAVDWGKRTRASLFIQSVETMLTVRTVYGRDLSKF